MKKTNLINNKKGFLGFPIFLIFFGLLLLLILGIIFKDKLVELFGSFGSISKSKTFWILIIITLVIVFRKFVLEVLMMLLKFIRGLLHV